jgi:hypothetical protein
MGSHAIIHNYIWQYSGKMPSNQTANSPGVAASPQVIMMIATPALPILDVVTCNGYLMGVFIVVVDSVLYPGIN